MSPYRIIDKYYPQGPLREILLTHSELVKNKALEAARNSGFPFDRNLIESGAILHDIGIFLCDAPSIQCLGTEPYIRHGILGGKLLRAENLPELARFCERHTGAGLTAQEILTQNLPLPAEDMLPETIEEKAVCYADKFYSKSGDITLEKPLDKVIDSMARHGEDSLQRFMELHRLFNKT